MLFLICVANLNSTLYLYIMTLDLYERQFSSQFDISTRLFNWKVFRYKIAPFTKFVLFLLGTSPCRHIHTGVQSELLKGGLDNVKTFLF